MASSSKFAGLSDTVSPMDEQALEKLDFVHVRDALARHCNCTIGKKLAHRMKPVRNATQVRHWFAQVQEMASLADAINLPPMAGVLDIAAHIHDSGTPAGCEPEHLARIHETLNATGNLTVWAERIPEGHDTIAHLMKRVGDFTPLGRKIGEVIDSRGEVRDSASPRLARIRATIDKSKVEIRTVVEKLVKQPHVQKMLQYGGSTFHGDRLVLPLRSEHRGRIPGIIHRSSDSGATFFVEPAEAVELNNDITRLKLDEHEEITRILSIINREVHLNAKEILATMDALAVLDLVAAKVRFMETYKAVCPEIRDDRRLDIRQARHPELIDLFAQRKKESKDKQDDSEVVPIDIRLGEDFDILIVTGPNTGGKTLSIKTLGLLVLMAQAGIPIPAGSGSTMPVYRDVFVDIGDEQSIEQSLSTYSGHISNVLKILSDAREDSLVLLDELGAGTDPEEGAAIGRAILDELQRIGCSSMLTTHLSTLKSVAFTVDRIDNASVEFDVESLRPTYRLRIGEPGNSNAIIIAQRLGMPARMVKSARQHLSGHSKALNAAIKGTLKVRREAEQAREQAGQARLEAEEQQKVLDQLNRELVAEREAYQKWTKWLNGLKAGDQVYVKTFRKNAKVVRPQLHRQTVVVSTGAIDMEISITDIDYPEEDD